MNQIIAETVDASSSVSVETLKKAEDMVAISGVIWRKSSRSQASLDEDRKMFWWLFKQPMVVMADESYTQIGMIYELVCIKNNHSFWIWVMEMVIITISSFLLFENLLTCVISIILEKQVYFVLKRYQVNSAYRQAKNILLNAEKDEMIEKMRADMSQF
jgi:hypothetical protein